MADNVTAIGIWNVVTTTVDYTARNHDMVLVDASLGAIAITLPAEHANVYVDVKKTDSSANIVTVTGVGTIDGSGNLTISTQYYSYTLVCDGTNWHII